MDRSVLDEIPRVQKTCFVAQIHRRGAGADIRKSDDAGIWQDVGHCDGKGIGIMQNVHYFPKLRRGSSPNREVSDAYRSWVGGLRFIENAPPISTKSHKRESRGRNDVPEKTSDEARWQDDGGENG